MHGRTAATLDELASAGWFAKVGVKDTDAADVLPDWAAAMASCASPEWQDPCLEAVNRYAAQVAKRSPEDYARWNEVVLDVRPSVLALVRAKTAPVTEEHSLPRVFLNTVAWDILHLCVESEFADIYPPGFFASQAYWYVAGHFPCDWSGAFPDGRLVIF